MGRSPRDIGAGAMSFHHRLTIHGSGPNNSSRPRQSFAVHLRTEKSWPRADADAYKTAHLEDPVASPIIFEDLGRQAEPAVGLRT